jgi:hypothetical protein
VYFTPCVTEDKTKTTLQEDKMNCEKNKLQGVTQNPPTLQGVKAY